MRVANRKGVDKMKSRFGLFVAFAICSALPVSAVAKEKKKQGPSVTMSLSYFGCTSQHGIESFFRHWQANDVASAMRVDGCGSVPTIAFRDSYNRNGARVWCNLNFSGVTFVELNIPLTQFYRFSGGGIGVSNKKTEGEIPLYMLTDYANCPKQQAL